MTASPNSQCDRILDVLADGQPHTMREIHDRIGPCRLNSRIAELRKRGHNITCDPARGRYIYTLHPAALDEGSTLAAAGPSSSAADIPLPAAPDPADDGGAPPCAVVAAEQLSLEVAA